MRHSADVGCSALKTQTKLGLVEAAEARDGGIVGRDGRVNDNWSRRNSREIQKTTGVLGNGVGGVGGMWRERPSNREA
jgi:hypothetical protein